MIEILSQPAVWVSLLTLTLLEIVLSIDNIVFVSIVVNRLPVEQRQSAQRIGLGLALLLRLALLSVISWIAGLTQPLFTVFATEISWRDLILLGGGLFLMAKSTMEIHDKLEGTEHHVNTSKVAASFGAIITEVVIVNLIFSVDSIVTAIGLVQHVEVMIVAVVISMAVMAAFSTLVSDFIERHPTMKMLALSFLLMIGLMLMVESLHVHVPKGYVYFAMAFSLGVEVLNMRLRKPVEPVHLHAKYVADELANEFANSTTSQQL